jgi:hypothetical protein
MRKAIIGERLFIRGDGYLSHIEQLFLEMFAPYESFFLERYEFKPSDIIDTFKQLESSFTLRVASPWSRNIAASPTGESAVASNV